MDAYEKQDLWRFILVEFLLVKAALTDVKTPVIRKSEKMTFSGYLLL